MWKNYISAKLNKYCRLKGKNMKRILFITTFYEQKSVSAAIRNSAWVDGLIDLGCEVTVLTVDWPESRKSEFLMNNNRAKVYRTHLAELDILKITISQIKKKSFSRLTPLRHFVRDIIYFPDICKNWAKKIDIPLDLSFDVLISSSDMKSSHYVAQKIKRLYPDIDWIQIWGDPWKDDVNLGWLNKRRAAVKEESLLAQADKVIYVSDITKERMSKSFPVFKDKFYYLPRGFYKTIEKKTCCHSTIRIVYTGVMSLRTRNSLLLLDSIQHLNETEECKIHIDFYGTYDGETTECFSQYECCSIHAAVDYEQVLKVYEESDALLFIANKGNSSQIPGKLFDYMGTNLPILCLVDSLTTDLSLWLKKYPRCLLIENTHEGMKIMTHELYDFVKHKFEIETEFSPNTIAEKLLSLL